MAYSRINYVGNGSQTQFAINFPLGFLTRSDVTCYVIGEVDGLGNQVYRTLTWINDGLVQVSGMAPDVGATVVFERTIDKATLVHDYSDGEGIIEQSLDESNKQNIMLVHEVLDGRFGVLADDIDMGQHTVKNLVDPVDDQDAVNLRFFMDNNASENKLAAEAAQAAADAYAASALSSRNTAVTAAASATADAAQVATDRDVVAADKATVSSDRSTVTLLASQVVSNAASVASNTATVATNTATVVTDAAQVAADKVAVASDKIAVHSDKLAADASAAAAAAYAASIALPNAAGHGTHYIRQKADESGFEYRTPAQVASDIGGAYDTLTAGEAIDTSTGPKLVYKDEFNQRGGGADRWWLVDSDATGPVKISPTIALATTSAASAGNTFTGVVRPAKVSGFTGLTSGTQVWAYSTAGALTQTAPAVTSSGAQNAVRVIGYAASTTEVEFQPYHDTVFHARNSALTSGSSVVLEHYTDSGARERVARAYLAQTAGVGSDVLPTFSGYTSGSWIISSSDDSNGAAWYAADNAVDNADFWNTSATQGQWIRFDNSGSAQTISGYTIQVSTSHAARGPSTWTFEAWNGSSWVVFDTQTTVAAWSSNEKRTYNLSGNVTFGSGQTYSGVRLNITAHYGGTTLIISEIELLQAQTARDEPLTIGSELINSSATDRVTVKFADASDANQDTKTTFYNRTGATRDLIVEVTL